MEDDYSMTEFNSNKATLIRLDRWLRYAAEAYFNDNYMEYYKHLMNLSQEIMIKMYRDREKKGKNKDDGKHEYDECNELIKDIESWIPGYSQGLLDQRGQMKFKSKLRELEFKLRIYADKKGMLLRDGEREGL